MELNELIVQLIFNSSDHDDARMELITAQLIFTIIVHECARMEHSVLIGRALFVWNKHSTFRMEKVEEIVQTVVKQTSLICRNIYFSRKLLFKSLIHELSKKYS